MHIIDNWSAVLGDRHAASTHGDGSVLLNKLSKIVKKATGNVSPIFPLEALLAFISITCKCVRVSWEKSSTSDRSAVCVCVCFHVGESFLLSHPAEVM